MRPKVLLARPHPFIVRTMEPLLAEIGFEATRPQDLAQLTGIATEASGAIISLALASDMQASAEQVFAALRATAPRLPVAFAAMLPLERVASRLVAMARVARQVGTPVDAGAPGADAPLGTPDALVYIAQSNLEDASRRLSVMTVLERHFG